MLLNQAETKNCRIHSTAIVSASARLGKNVEVGPYAIVGGDVVIGENTKIGPHAVIDGWTRIGKACMIYAAASIGSEPQDRKFKNEKSYVVIGDNTHIREFVTIHRAIGVEQETRIGDSCLLLAYSQVAHNCLVGNHVILSNAVNLAGHVRVEDRVTIGGLAGVHQFVKIGRNAMIGGAARVVQDVPPFITVAGNPAKPAGLNTVGLIRSGINEETRRILKQAYKILYLAGLPFFQAVEAIEQGLPHHGEVRDFIQFLRSSERGICRIAPRCNS
ncbi:acyl-ACP--UDP-N-acetylglucosamine O-acyltransferase|uniref:Acyl-[acyl-carrier-protein]--UDP-N-acetylglucosamine O-acyltransferase n=1 Tax=Dendrosporobacter quercicolus TaxID=146817 RepID=A0A1G9T3H5_9FIRM|nr:acyl-ACP--UDP-N-acetylglucosamine O-acyltransferase [Dendrosporobacter quercicolus]NSL48495.1 acyl-ACP--UDP-N-acetylglucosamine O-acyltransferase [Dendrosporobacter quercicolus DSM 1736]SDM42182.1 acyl-[acyl-carrier-protein]--UDP-N-acetylglucosamine O-acyltransferase [Dendrosporobacter quercicolus]